MPQTNLYACLVVALLIASATSRSAQAMAEETGELHFQSRIKAIATEKDPEVVRQLVADVEASGEAQKDVDYYNTLIALCKALNSSADVDPDRALIAWKLADRVLSSSEPKPPGIEVMLLRFAQTDPELGKLKEADLQKEGSIRGREWQAERLRRLQLVLATWGHLQSAIKNLPPESNDFIEKVWPPVEDESYPDDNLDPAEVRDPVLRKEYEAALAVNAEKERIQTERHAYVILEDRLRQNTKRFIEKAYSKPPFDTEELETTLADSTLDKKFQTEIVADVKKRVAERIERDEKRPGIPAIVQSTEIPPPGTAVYHSDPRFRKKVAFKLVAPKIEEILDQLREQTGVALTRADDIQNDYPARGGIIFSGTPAWKVMDKVAAYERVEGRWEKDGDGYWLVRNGNPVAPPEINEFAQVQPSPGWQRGVRLIGIAFTTAVIGVLLYLLIRRRRLATH